jgi:hypothetical protein
MQIKQSKMLELRIGRVHLDVIDRAQQSNRHLTTVTIHGGRGS